MRKCDLTAEQLLNLNIFNLILECAGWEDLNETERRFDAGFRVTPEGARTFDAALSQLEARYHAPINMITLRISEPGNRLAVLHFLFEKSPEKILEWLSEHGPGMGVDTYEPMLVSAEKCCELTLIESPDTEQFDLRPPKPDQGYGWV